MNRRTILLIGLLLLGGVMSGCIEKSTTQPSKLTPSTTSTPPKALASVTPTIIYEGESVSFSAAGSFDPDGSIVTYAWDFGDGSTATQTTVTHTYSASGNYTVMLTVKDNDGLSDTTTASIIVRPRATITIASPSDGAEVSWREVVEGISEGVHDSELNVYVLIYPINAGGPWWVQPEVDIFPDGKWEVNCYFGRDPQIYPEDKGANFRISAIVTREKLKEGQQLQKLPSYVVRDEIRVTRK
jgi:hypothetical protein